MKASNSASIEHRKFDSAFNLHLYCARIVCFSNNIGLFDVEGSKESPRADTRPV